MQATGAYVGLFNETRATSTRQLRAPRGSQLLTFNNTHVTEAGHVANGLCSWIHASLFPVQLAMPRRYAEAAPYCSLFRISVAGMAGAAIAQRRRETVLLVNLRWPSGLRSAIRALTLQAIDRRRKHGERVVLAGDFNLGTIRTSALLAEHLPCAVLCATGPRDAHTWQGFVAGRLRRSAIDHFAVSPQIVSSTSIDWQIGADVASDHATLICSVVLHPELALEDAELRMRLSALPGLSQRLQATVLPRLEAARALSLLSTAQLRAARPPSVPAPVFENMLLEESERNDPIVAPSMALRTTMLLLCQVATTANSDGLPLIRPKRPTTLHGRLTPVLRARQLALRQRSFAFMRREAAYAGAMPADAATIAILDADRQALRADVIELHRAITTWHKSRFALALGRAPVARFYANGGSLGPLVSSLRVLSGWLATNRSRRADGNVPGHFDTAAPVLSATGALAITRADAASIARDYFQGAMRIKPGSKTEQEFAEILLEAQFAAIRQFPPEAQHRLAQVPTQNELVSALLKGGRAKSPGPDGLPREFLEAVFLDPPPAAADDAECRRHFATRSGRCLSPCGVLMLQVLAECWLSATLPQPLVLSRLAPVLKNNSPDSDMSSYRPIACLQTMMKVITAVIAERLSVCSELYGIFGPEQSGFRSREEAPAQVAAMLTTLSERFAHGLVSGVILYDFKAAYDSVNLGGLWAVLRRLAIPPGLLSVIQSMYLGARAFVYGRQFSRSADFPLQQGVRQGDPLSPILFNLYMEVMILTPIRHEFPSIVLNPLTDSRGPSLGAFADDLATISAISNADELLHFRAKHAHVMATFDVAEMVATVKKTQLLISRARDTRPLACDELMRDPITISGRPIRPSNEVKYLGLLINYHLSLHSMAEGRLAAGRAALAAMKPILKHADVAYETKIDLIKSSLMPVLLYGAEVWADEPVLAGPSLRKLTEVLRWALLATLPHSCRVSLASMRSEFAYNLFDLDLIGRAQALRMRAAAKFPLLKTWIGVLSRPVLGNDKAPWVALLTDRQDPAPVGLLADSSWPSALAQQARACWALSGQTISDPCAAALETIPGRIAFLKREFSLAAELSFGSIVLKAPLACAPKSEWFHRRHDFQATASQLRKMAAVRPYLCRGVRTLIAARLGAPLGLAKVVLHGERRQHGAAWPADLTWYSRRRAACPACEQPLAETLEHIMFACPMWRPERISLCLAIGDAVSTFIRANGLPWPFSQPLAPEAAAMPDAELNHAVLRANELFGLPAASKSTLLIVMLGGNSGGLSMQNWVGQIALTDAELEFHRLPVDLMLQQHVDPLAHLAELSGRPSPAAAVAFFMGKIKGRCYGKGKAVLEAYKEEVQHIPLAHGAHLLDNNFDIYNPRADELTAWRVNHSAEVTRLRRDMAELRALQENARIIAAEATNIAVRNATARQGALAAVAVAEQVQVAARQTPIAAELVDEVTDPATWDDNLVFSDADDLDIDVPATVAVVPPARPDSPDLFDMPDAPAVAVAERPAGLRLCLVLAVGDAHPGAFPNAGHLHAARAALGGNRASTAAQSNLARAVSELIREAIQESNPAPVEVGRGPEGARAVIQLHRLPRTPVFALPRAARAPADRTSAGLQSGDATQSTVPHGTVESNSVWEPGVVPPQEIGQARHPGPKQTLLLESDDDS